jgi:hypothetical protein
VAPILDIVAGLTRNAVRRPLNYRVRHRNGREPVFSGNILDDQGSRVRFPAGAGNFSLHHRVQNGSVAHPAPYPMGARGSFPGGKAAGA